MTALANGRQSFRSPNGKRTAGQKASTTIYQGGIVMLDSSGYAAPGATATGYIGAGVAKSNSGTDRWTATAVDGAVDVEYEEGVFGFVNSASTDAITAAHQGRVCYIVDDQTVALTSGVGTRSPAGRIHHLGGDGLVYVEFSAEIARQIAVDTLGVEIITIPVVLSKHTTSSIAARFTPGFAGRITKMTASVTDPATTAAKLGTFTPAVATVATTGAAVALTSANCTPVGAKIDGSAITAGDAFGATDEITIAASAVTAFVEGQVVLHLYITRA